MRHSNDNDEVEYLIKGILGLAIITALITINLWAPVLIEWIEGLA